MELKGYTLKLMVALLLPISLFSQYTRKEAKSQFDEGNYKLAIDILNKIPDVEKDKKAITYRGIAHYQINNLDDALQDLSTAKKLGNNDLELMLYVARIYQHKGNYEEAVNFYRAYLKELKKGDAQRQIIIDLIKNCGYAINNKDREDLGLVENLGNQLNGAKNEIYPLFSPYQHNQIYFSSDVTTDYDIYLGKLISKTWLRSSNFETKLNSTSNDIVQCFTPQGEALFFEKGNKEQSQLFYSFFESEFTSYPFEFFNQKDNDFYFVDPETIVFSSIKDEGYGGYDLYITEYINGKWTQPKNLGATINSAFDERSPFMTPDRKKLFFSSNRIEGYGGFDIFRSSFSPDWLEPENMGSPINSPSNELFFKVSDAGHMAIMSSDRKTGYGGFDVYQVFLKEEILIDKDDQQIISFITVPEKSKIQIKEEQTEDLVETSVPVKKASPKIANAKEVPLKKDETNLKGVLISDNSIQEVHSEIEVVNKKEPQKEIREEPTSDSLAQFEATDKQEKQATSETEVKTDTSDLSSRQDRKVQNTPLNMEASNPISSEKHNKLEAMGIENPYSKKEMSYELTSLYYDNPDLLLTKENETELLKVLEILNYYPNSNVILTAHSQNRGLMEYQLFRTVRYAEKVATYLELNNIERDRIVVKSVASSYPFIKRTAPSDLKKYNQKVDVHFNGISDPNFKLSYTSPQDPKEYEIDNRYEVYYTVVDELYYRVEITRQEQMYKSFLLRNYTDLMVEKPNEKDEIIYYIGLYPNYADVKELQESLNKTAVPYSRIVAFYNGKRLDLDEASTMIGEFPQLNQYIKALQE